MVMFVSHATFDGDTKERIGRLVFVLEIIILYIYVREESEKHE